MTGPKMVTIAERVEFARQAAYVNRCHNMRILNENTVGIHSHNMVSMYLILCPAPKLAVVRGLQFHDYGERGAGDVPAPAKWFSPEFKSRYEDLQSRVLFRFGLAYADDLTEEDHYWIHGLDRLEFMLYAQDELAYGNRHVVPQLEAIHGAIEKMIKDGTMPYELKAYYLAVLNERPVFREEEIFG